MDALACSEAKERGTEKKDAGLLKKVFFNTMDFSRA